MNVTLPEEKAIKKRQIILYIIILVVCIVCVMVAFYIQFYARIDLASLVGMGQETKLGTKTDEEKQTLKSEFNQLFTNGIEDDGSNDDKKIDSSQKLVYTKYQKKETKLNSYDLEVNIPAINIKSDTIDKYNQEIEEIFLKMANLVLQSQNNNAVYTVDYVANIKDDILSVMVKSNLKEGSKAQKAIIQTYNYDLRNNKELSLADMLKIERVDSNKVQEQINTEIATEQKKADDLKSLGYNIYSRNTSSDIYKIDKTTEFYWSGNALYIIYAYGNETATTEMDIVIL